VKVVAKKNLRILLPDFTGQLQEGLVPPQVPPPTPSSPSQAASAPAVSASTQSVPQASPSNSLTLGPQLALATNVDLVPSRDTLRRASEKVRRDVSALLERCAARQAAGGETSAGTDICDVFMRLNISFETFLEISEMYQKAHGTDDELQEDCRVVTECYEDCVEQYRAVRSWGEMAQDEWNLTQYSIRKHGLVGTLKNEFVEVGQDVVEIGRDASGLIQAGADVAPRVAEAVPRIVRQATGNVGGAIGAGSQVAASAAGSVLERTQRQATHTLEQQIVGPVKRAWHLVVTAFLLCFIVPLFGLRAFAPLNSVVSNLGLVYGAVCLVCPPRCARTRRAAKAGLLLLWPLITVVFPLVLHYWLMHPPTGPWQPMSWRIPEWSLQQVSLPRWSRLRDLVRPPGNATEPAGNSSSTSFVQWRSTSRALRGVRRRPRRSATRVPHGHGLLDGEI